MFKKIIAMILCLCACASLTACSDVVDVKSNNDGFENKETGIGYILCNRSVYALKLGDVYAEDENGVKYCKIPFEDPLKFLCDKDEELPCVYRSANEPDITIDNFNPVAAFLYLEGETSMYIAHWVAEGQFLTQSAAEQSNVQDDSEYTYAVRDAMTTQEPVRTVAPTVDDMNTDYTVHIRLLSPDYPGLYYEVVFWRDINGVNYLYDMGTGNSYLCPYKVTYILWEDK